jgi:hypothetical protein
MLFLGVMTRINCHVKQRDHVEIEACTQRHDDVGG